MYYDTGWNDYIENKPLPESCTRDYRDGWLDARLYEKTYGVKPTKQ